VGGLRLVAVDRRQLARVAAPAAFLLAATVAILLVRSALHAGDDPSSSARPPAGTTAAVTDARRVVTAPSATTAPTAPPATTAPAAEYYVIQEGDTLATVADQYGTSVEQLLVLNPDVDPVSLSIGQRIRVQ
jgi:LysM repeat protein